MEFISRNLTEVLKTEGYTHMSKHCPALLIDVLAKVASAKTPREGGRCLQNSGGSRDCTRSRDAMDEVGDWDGGGGRRVEPRLD